MREYFFGKFNKEQDPEFEFSVYDSEFFVPPMDEEAKRKQDKLMNRFEI